MKNKKRLLQVLFLTLVIFFSMLTLRFYIKINESNIQKVSTVQKKSNVEGSNMEKDKEVSIIAVGDILVHDEQLKAAYIEESNTYDFNNNFEYIKKYIQDADISYATAEGTYVGKEETYSGYPLFNSPESMLEALKKTGFDIINGANNHILDKGSKGYFKTIENFKKSSMDYIGLKAQEDESNNLIKNVNDIKIGFTSYTYETPRQKGRRAVNAIVIPDSINGLLNTFGYENLDKDLLKIKEDIDDMKSNGAEFIVVGMHWGNEYSTTVSKEQEKIANKLNEFGVDLILGSHPHVVQTIDTIKNKETGKETLVVYSMGNFISNQRKETMGNRLAADGIMVNINIKKNDEGKVNIESYKYIPTWVYKFKNEDNETQYLILPTEDILATEDTSEFPKEVLKAIKTSLESTTNIVEE